MIHTDNTAQSGIYAMRWYDNLPHEERIRVTMLVIETKKLYRCNTVEGLEIAMNNLKISS